MTDYHDRMVYVFEAGDMRILEQVKRRLYGDGTPLTSDERRDLANTLDAALRKAGEIEWSALR